MKITKRLRKAGKAPRSVKYARHVNLVKDSTKYGRKYDRSLGLEATIGNIDLVEGYNVMLGNGGRLEGMEEQIVPKEVICDGTSTEACAAEVSAEMDNE